VEVFCVDTNAGYKTKEDFARAFVPALKHAVITNIDRKGDPSNNKKAFDWLDKLQKEAEGLRDDD
jgi:hypothetical protein